MQANNQGKSFEDLLAENKSLRNKLADFELLLGDAKKKRV
jgi:hypothetical protein